MNDRRLNLIGAGQTLDLVQLSRLQQRPEPFTPGETLFWDDPYISSQMLAFHLDPDQEAASRPPAFIDRSVTWLMGTLGLNAGAALLDLGCGPGLYASRLARLGLSVTGVDYSRRSIAYAAQAARDQKLTIIYRYQNYLELSDDGLYDAALLIYGDFCPLNPQQRALLLRNVHRALKPGGFFVLDVSTPSHHRNHTPGKTWRVEENGFWRAARHLVLDQSFDYPEQEIYLNQAVVLEEGGRISVYRMWFQDYNPQSIRSELESDGFSVESLWGDLAGKPYAQDGEWIGVVARKV